MMPVAQFPVEGGHVLCFAGAIGEVNPIYTDAEYAAASEFGSIIAPPTFTAAEAQFDPDWKQRPRIGERWFGSASTPSGAPSPTAGQGSSLHAEEHIEYHAPIKVGAVLRVEVEPGKSWEKHSIRVGRLLFSEVISRYFDQNGELLVTTRRVRVVTEKTG
jgi:acyl dehydratase